MHWHSEAMKGVSGVDVLLHFAAVGTLEDHLVVSYTDLVFFEVMASCSKKASVLLVPSFFCIEPWCADMLLLFWLRFSKYFFFFDLWLLNNLLFLFFIVSFIECNCLLQLIRWWDLKNFQLVCQNSDLCSYLSGCGPDYFIAKTLLRVTFILIHLHTKIYLNLSCWVLYILMDTIWLGGADKFY